MQPTRRLGICLVACAAIAAFSVPSSASLSEGERMLEANRFKEAIRLLAEAAETGSADDAERARALRGLAVGYLALEEGVEALGACAEAILLDPGHVGNVGLVKIIERELNLSGVPAEWDDTLLLIQNATEQHPLIRGYVTDLEIATHRFHGDFDAAERTYADYGAISDFMVAGPFPNTASSGVYEQYPPEFEIDQDARYTDHLGRGFGWEPLRPGRTDHVDLDLFLGDEPNAVAYALTHVRAPEPMSTTVSIFGRGAFRLWVNGEPVVRERTTRMDGQSLYEAEVRLEEGWNRVLLKAGAETEPLDFSLALRDEDERVLHLDSSSDPAVHVRGGRPAAPIDETMPPYDFDSLPDGSWLTAWRDAVSEAPLCDWYSYITFLMLHGFEIEAERATATSEERFPGSAVVAGARADLLNAQNRAGEAALVLRELAEEAPEYTPAATYVVGELLERGELDEAWSAASSALSRHPNNVTLRAMHGALLAARGSVSEGTSEMRAAFEERPTNHAVRTLYLMLLELLQGESEHERALQQALEARPDDPSLYRQAAASAYGRKDYDDAIAHLRHAERIGERTDVIDLSVGRVLEEAGQLEEALAIYESALETAPRSVPLHQTIARLLQRMGEDERALGHYRAVVERRPRAFAEKELVRRLEGRPPLDDYFPEADIESLLETDLSWVGDDETAVRLHESQHVIVYRDGAHVLRRHTVTRVLNEAGVQAYGSARTPYFFESADGQVELARTLKSDGREVDADMGLGEVTFADLEPGDVVELRYVVKYGPVVGLPGHFWHRHFFQTELPCAESRMALLLPNDEEYGWEVNGAGIRPSVDERDGWTLSVWEMNDVPAITLESRMPPWTEAGIWLDISTIPEWSEIAAWYHGVSRGRLHGGRRALQLAGELSQPGSSDREKVKVVTDYVRKNIKYEGSGFIESGLVPRSLEDVLRTRLGDCKDQSVLLVFLLRKMGLAAHVALVNDRSVSTVEHLPSPDFTHAIVRAVTRNGDVYWIDPTEQELAFPNVPVELEGALALPVDIADSAFTPIEPDPPGANGSRSVLRAAIDEAGDLTVSGDCRYRGEDAAEFRLIARHYSEMLEEVKRDIIAAEHPAAVVDSVEFRGAEDTDAEMRLRLRFKRSGAVSRAGDLMIVGVPWTIGTVPHDLVSLEHRAHPLILDSWRGSYVETVELTVPEGYSLTSELPSVESSCSSGRFSLVGEERGDGTVVLIKKLDINVFRVEPSDYEAFRAMLETGWRAEEQQLVFERR